MSKSFKLLFLLSFLALFLNSCGGGPVSIPIKVSFDTTGVNFPLYLVMKAQKQAIDIKVDAHEFKEVATAINESPATVSFDYDSSEIDRDQNYFLSIFVYANEKREEPLFLNEEDTVIIIEGKPQEVEEVKLISLKEESPGETE